MNPFHCSSCRWRLQRVCPSPVERLGGAHMALCPKSTTVSVGALKSQGHTLIPGSHLQFADAHVFLGCTCHFYEIITPRAQYSYKFANPSQNGWNFFKFLRVSRKEVYLPETSWVFLRNYVDPKIRSRQVNSPKLQMVFSYQKEKLDLWQNWHLIKSIIFKITKICYS